MHHLRHMALKIFRPHLAALAFGALAALPAAAHATGASDQGVQEQSVQGEDSSGHAGDPSGPRPQEAGDQGDPAPAPQAEVLPEQTVGVTRATPGDTFDVVASAEPARASRVSRRAFTIRIARGIHVASAKVWVDGSPAQVSYGRRTTARVDLRGKPRGRVTVRIKVRTREGAVIEATRTYETCGGKRAGSVPSV